MLRSFVSAGGWLQLTFTGMRRHWSLRAAAVLSCNSTGGIIAGIPFTEHNKAYESPHHICVRR